MMRGIKENTLLVDISSIRHVSCHYLNSLRRLILQ